MSFCSPLSIAACFCISSFMCCYSSKPCLFFVPGLWWMWYTIQNELWVVRVVQVNKGFADYRHRDRALSQLPPAFSGLHFILETSTANPRGCYAEPSPLATHNRRSLKELINQPTTIYRRGKNAAPGIWDGTMPTYEQANSTLCIQ